MLTLKINYYIHLLLNSKYRMFMNLFIILTIYSLFYGTKIIYCMTESSDIPELVEDKASTHRKAEFSNIEQLINRHVDSYIGDKALIQQQAEEIARLNREIDFKNDLHAALKEEQDYFTILTRFADSDFGKISRTLKEYGKNYVDLCSEFEDDDVYENYPDEDSGRGSFDSNNDEVVNENSEAESSKEDSES